MKTLKELIKNRIFRIPDYQRGYSWDRKQIDELINDIENIKIQAEKSFHFTGILSYSKFKNDDFKQKEGLNYTIDNDFEVYHIVDGQQRLTTIFILLFECYKLLDEEGFEGEFINQILKVKSGESLVYRFGYDVDVPSREFLYSQIFEDENFKVTKPPTLYTNNLLNAKKHIKEYFIESAKSEQDLKKTVKSFLRKLENKLLFQEFVIDTNKLNVAMVFETMNYRGKNLSKLELFKNRLIYLVSNRVVNTKEDREEVEDIRNQITNTWLVIYSWLGKISEVKLNDDAFLRAFTIVHFDNNNSVNKEFKNILNKLFEQEFPISSNETSIVNLEKENLFKMLETMKLIAKSYYIINNPFSNDQELIDLNISDDLKRALYILIHINGADYMKTLVCATLAHYFSVENRNTRGLLEFLIEVEKHQMILFNFLGRKINANREKIYRLCNSVYDGVKNYSQVCTEISNYTHSWWDKREKIDYFKSKIESYTRRFYDIDGIKLLLFIKEVESDKISLTKLDNYKLDLIFPNEHGGNAKFPNVVRSREPLSNEILKYSVGNFILLENKLVGAVKPNQADYFNKRKEIWTKSKVLKNAEIGEKLAKWSDADILNRGKDFFEFISNRYQINIDSQSLKQILVDNVVIAND